MSSGERPIGAAKGKPSDTGALCQTSPPPAVPQQTFPGPQPAPELAESPVRELWGSRMRGGGGLRAGSTPAPPPPLWRRRTQTKRRAPPPPPNPLYCKSTMVLPFDLHFRAFRSSGGGGTGRTAGPRMAVSYVCWAVWIWRPWPARVPVPMRAAHAGACALQRRACHRPLAEGAGAGTGAGVGGPSTGGTAPLAGPSPPQKGSIDGPPQNPTETDIRAPEVTLTPNSEKNESGMFGISASRGFSKAIMCHGFSDNTNGPFSMLHQFSAPSASDFRITD